jgi:hypothetical protein
VSTLDNCLVADKPKAISDKPLDIYCPAVAIAFFFAIKIEIYIP